jgi:hypothetical protein
MAGKTNRYNEPAGTKRLKEGACRTDGWVQSTGRYNETTKIGKAQLPGRYNETTKIGKAQLLGRSNGLTQARNCTMIVQVQRAH